MNNEKETEKICNVLNGIITYGIDEQVCGTRWKKSQVGNSSIAKVLINKGYGNVKQAVKEFAEKLKEKMELNGYRSLLHNRIIDNLITELYGADE